MIIFAIVENFAQAPVIWTVSGDSIVVREVEDFQDTSLISIKYKSMREMDGYRSSRYIFNKTVR